MSRQLRNRAYLLLMLCGLLLYTQFMSTSLDDFDSFSFAFALERWDNALLEVQAPGFPVYLIAGKGLETLVGDSRLALTLLSAISGALGLVAVAWIGDGLRQTRAGLLAAVLLLFMPGYWLNSEYALSDMPGLVLMLAAIGFLLHSKEWRWHFVIGCVLTGLTLGLRPHNGLPLALAGLYALWQVWTQTAHHERTRTIAIGLAAGVFAIALWLVPVAQTFNGLDGYIQHIEGHGEHVQRSDSILRNDLNADMLRLRAETYLTSWSHLLAGGGRLSMLLISGLLLVGLVRVPLRSQATVFLVVWLVAAGIMIFLVASPTRPRLYLPALAPLVLLAAYGYTRYRATWLRAIPVLLLVALLIRTPPLVFRLNQESAPPVQAVNYIRENYPLDTANTIVVSQGSFKAAQYYLGDQHQLYTPHFNADIWREDVQNRHPDYIFVLDGDEVPLPVFDAITTPHDYVSVDDRVFERDRRVFPQHVTVRMQVFIPRDQLSPEQLPLPVGGQIAAGEPVQGRYFGEGWYRIELIGPTPGRWANEITVMRVALPPQTTTVTFLATPFGADQAVDIVVNDRLIETLPLNVVWGEYTFTIPEDAIAGHPISTIELRHAFAEFPENHYRQLAAAYSIFTFRSGVTGD